MIRVFARKTNATPEDEFAYYGEPPMFLPRGQQVHVSCTFTYDKCRAEWLADQWTLAGHKVELGGPAYDDPGKSFVPGRYLKRGIVMTSRGCNNNCWFCYVPKREGKITEMTLTNGWNVMDSNLLQCSDLHIVSVFHMLQRQKHKPVFTGGLEAAILKDWHVDFLTDIKTERVYFAYDTPDDYEPLVVAAKKMQEAGFKYNRMSCYVLIGHPKDNMIAAERRLKAVATLGVMPFAMLWRGSDGKYDTDWRQFQREWANPYIVGSKMKEYKQKTKEIP